MKFLKNCNNYISFLKNKLIQKKLLKRIVFLLFYKKDLAIIISLPVHYDTISFLVPLLIAKYNILLVCCFSKKQRLINNNSNKIKIVYDWELKSTIFLRTKLIIIPVIGDFQNIRWKVPVVHFMISLSGINVVYGKNMFDPYDYIFCAGEYQVEDLKVLFNERGLTGKCLIRGGYPKLDWMLKKRNDVLSNHVNNNQRYTVIYAPTHTYSENYKFTTIDDYAEQIIDLLLTNGFSVIFRPHPVSFLDNSLSVVEKINLKHRNNINFELDNSANYFESYIKADIMITDLSGTGFTFSFTFEKPTIFFAPADVRDFSLKGMHFEKRESIGEVARNFKELIEKLEVIENNREFYKQKIIHFRNDTIFNLGKSAEYFVGNLNYILENKKNKDWEYI